MLTKTAPDEIQNFLSDASNMAGGSVERVLFPETAEEVAEVFFFLGSKSSARVTGHILVADNGFSEFRQ